MISILPYYTAHACIALAISSVSSVAGTVTWGVQAQGVADFDVFSDGALIADPDFGYELGVFVPTFTPLPENVSLWDANWVRIGDRSALDFASGSYGDTVDIGSLVMVGSGSQVYVWGDNSRDAADDLEWVLYTAEDWLAVEAAEDLIWRPAEASRAVVGRIATTDPVEAGGTVSRPVVLGSNAIQTAAVPEPGVPALLIIGLSACALRRVRRTKLPVVQ